MAKVYRSAKEGSWDTSKIDKSKGETNASVTKNGQIYYSKD